MHTVVIFGPPGSGKGTHSKLIAEKYGYKHLSTGDIFRREMQNQTALGELVSKYINRGILVPDAIVLREFFKEVLNYKNSPGLIFDGFPRTLQQAEVLDRVMEKKGLGVDLVIFLDVEEKELLRRVLGRRNEVSRTDDNPAVFRKRLQTYHKQTSPVINFYKKQGKFIKIDGMHDIQHVFAMICGVMDNYLDKMPKQ